MANTRERKPAPPVVVDEVHRDDRAAVIAQLDKENPEFVHSFQRLGTSSDELRRKNMEVVKDSDGREITHESDFVVKTSKERYEQRKRAEAAESMRGSMKIAKSPEDIMQFRQPKKVRIKKENEE